MAAQLEKVLNRGIGKAELITRIALQMTQWLDEIAANPIHIEEDGGQRIVHFVTAFAYGYCRQTQEVFAGFLQEEGGWAWATLEHPSHLGNLDPLIPRNTWRQRIGYALRVKARTQVVDAALAQADTPLDDKDLGALHKYACDIAWAAWQRAGLSSQIDTRFPTRRMRALLGQALALDPEVLALARQCCGVYQPPITNRFLTFVWRNRDTLARIQRQTPNLLPVVAKYMSLFGVSAADPTQATKAWLQVRGVSRAACLLLDVHGLRPFQNIVERFGHDDGMDALVLALKLTQTGHGAVLYTPAAACIVLDAWNTASAATIQRAIAALPPRMLRQFMQRAEAARDAGEAQAVTQDIRNVLDWWQQLGDTPPDGLANAGWRRWLLLAEEAKQRSRLALANITWASPLSEFEHATGKAVALTNALALFDEGKRMQHCINNFREDCIRGQYLVFHTELEQSGKPHLATIALRRNALDQHRWAVTDMRGVTNSRFGKPLPDIAVRLAERCNTIERMQAKRAAARQRAIEQNISWQCTTLASFKDWRGKATAITSALELFDHGAALGHEMYPYAEECARGQAQVYRVVIENRYAWKTYGLDRYENFAILLRQGAAGWEVADVRTNLNMRYTLSAAEPFAMKLAAACNHASGGAALQALLRAA